MDSVVNIQLEKAAEQRNKESEGKSVRVNNLGFYSFEGSTPRSSSGLKSTAKRETWMYSKEGEEKVNGKERKSRRKIDRSDVDDLINKFGACLTITKYIICFWEIIQTLKIAKDRYVLADKI